MIIISAHKFTKLCNLSVNWSRFTNFLTMFVDPYCLFPPSYATIIFHSEITKHVSSASPTSFHDFSHTYSCTHKCMFVCVVCVCVCVCVCMWCVCVCVWCVCVCIWNLDRILHPGIRRKQFFYSSIFIPPYNLFISYSYITISFCYLVLILWFKGSWVNEHSATNYLNGIATI